MKSPRQESYQDMTEAITAEQLSRRGPRPELGKMFFFSFWNC